ncbi:MAG: hypothetical protein Q7U38_04320 [Methylobacter sp.]|nr:hypothetical protein [Methylobacter sp.]MDP2098377.1 hypothetical protein [Methylobacter sp.]MDP2426978.1 hypothetical protein [Methylobacter sp.]MDP3053719.1 hypothetical protein [Methylobacter sp.]MDP3361796.1 hypothetical protein [Methylobacter sp.]
MPKKICSTCHGGSDNIEIQCTNCSGTGYDPNEDNEFAQCHSCYGEGTVQVDICPDCNDEGKIDDEDEGL